MGEFLLLKELHRPPPPRPSQTSEQSRYLTAEQPCRASGFVHWVDQVQSDFRPLGQLEGVFDVDAEVPDRALDLGMPE